MNQYTGFEIAVIGMSGKFPKADNISEFWAHLKEGKDCISTFDLSEALKEGESEALLKDPSYVAARAYLENKEYFDNDFFGYRPDEAELMDPQIRLYHECCWQALEDSGYNPAGYKDKIGLFASASPSTNWSIHSFSKNRDGLVNEFTASHLREISFLSTMISYKLNLKGPSIFLQTACSSSLVAIHQACNSLLLGECSMALAGGISISNYSRRGYVYQSGMILSRDGKCRPFDAGSSGTVGGEGAGVVVLKKLQDALRDRDHIYAVVKGTGINNDGNAKAGYTAPSVNGQADAIRKAHRMAGVSAESISYVEAHGTGTELGDPIEIAALNEVFGKSGRPAESCAIGSAKSNIGHLDAAAGVAGFIKTVLSLKHGVLPASLHYERANPRIDFASGPFYVNSSLREWRGNGKPLRAGVSSFGIGGTNAHLVLEEAPAAETASAGRGEYLLVLSAKSASSLERYCERLSGYLKDHENISMADLSYTLQQGRARFPYRKVLVCRDRADAIEQLGTSGGIYEGSETAESLQHIVFMFPGQGSQYREMCAGLYQRERVFRETLEECLSLSAPYSDLDFRAALFVTDSGLDINRTEYAQPLLFMVEYSLSQLLIFWGLRPDYMIGHSIGEYVAACISGVFSLSDALRLVVRRGELMGSVKEGRMLSVSMGAEELRPLLSGHPGVDLSVINSPVSVVVGGELAAVDAFGEWLSAQGHSCKALHTSHAFHSSMMSAILDRFEQEFSTIEIHAPRIAYVSNMSGELVSYEELSKPAYWSSHLREPVNFFGGASRLLREGGALLIEVGAGRSLCNYIQESGLVESGHHLVNLVRQFGQQVSDEFYLAGKLGELWLKGGRFHWDNYYSDECRGRISVPGYCFEKIRYTANVDSRKLLLGSRSFVRAVADEKEEVVGHVSGWHRSESPNAAFELKQRQTYVVFSDTHGFGAGLKGYLESHGQHVIDGDVGSMDELWAELSTRGTVVHQIIYCLALSEGVGEVGYGSVSASLEPGYLGLCRLGKSLSGIGQVDKIGVTVLGNHLARVLEGDKVNPVKSTVIGAVKVLPSEMHQISCKVIDISYPFGSLFEEECCQEQIVNELFYETDRAYVAYRGKERWVPVYQALKIDSRLHSAVGIKPGGVYIVTGGFGGMGFTVCRSLVEDHGAVVILVHRSFFPVRADWDSWLSVHGPDDPTSERIGELLELESGGGRIDLYQLDVGSETEISVFSDQIRKHYGQIHGLVWAAGEVDYGGIVLNRKEADFRRYLSSKVDGVLLFEQYLDFGSMDFISLFSSIGNVFYQSKFGQVGYNAANEFMESYAVYARDRFKGHIFTVNWCDWYDVGMTVKTLGRKYPGTDITGLNGHIESGIYPAEGLAAFYNCLYRKPSVFTIYKGNLEEAVIAHREAYEHRKAGLGVVDAGTSFSGDSIEDRLRQIFVHFFGKTGISSKDNFFELGGDSLKGMTLIGRINQEIGCQLTIGDLYRCPDIGELARELESRQGKVGVHIPRLEIQQSYVLSSAQQRMYFLQQLDHGSVLYNETQLFWLHGDLDRDRLEDTFRGLIRQHESLRTSFVIVDGEPRQLILDEFDFCLEHYQCADSEVQLCISAFVRPFDLSAAPLYRVGIVECAVDKHLMMIDLHHIVADGVSHGILIRDFMSLYNGDELSVPDLRYRDYAEWQQGESQQALISGQRLFWLNEFSKEVPVLELPTDYSRPSVRSHSGSTSVFTIGMEQALALKQLAEDGGASVFMFLLSVYNILLSRLSGQDEIVVGVPVAGRVHASLEGIVGMFINMLPLRNSLDPELSFREFLQEVKNRAVTCFDNQDYQLEELVEELKVKRSANRNPLFDVVFVHRNYENPKAVMGDLVMEVYPEKQGPARFDLTLQSTEMADGIELSFEYSTELFTAGTIERFIRYFKHILTSVLNAADVCLSSIEMLDSSERDAHLGRFDHTGVGYPSDETIIGLFSKQVASGGDRVALRFNGTFLTYRELDRLSTGVGHMLRKRGVVADQVIGLLTDRSLHTVVGMLGILKAGGCYLPIDIDYPAERRAYYIRDSGTSLVLTSRSFGVDSVDGADLLFIEDSSSGADVFLEPVNKASDLCYIIYTSGTTGNPKGVMVEHKNIVRLFFNEGGLFDFGPDDVWTMFHSPCFDFSVWEIYGALLFGGTLVIVPKMTAMDTQNYLEVLRSEKVTILNQTPSAFYSLMGQELMQTSKELSLRYVIFGGEALSVGKLNEWHQKYPGVRLINMYGITETTVHVTSKEITAHEISANINDIGFPIPTVLLYILDSGMHAVAEGVIGELYVGGEGVSRGYLDRPTLNKEKFLTDPYRPSGRLYRTGDLGRVTAEGRIEYMGRGDQQIQLRGFRIELGEIESYLHRYEGISGTVVIASGSVQEDLSLIAYYVSDELLDRGDLKRYLLERLPEYMVPAHYIRLSVIPLTSNGKLDREALPLPEYDQRVHNQGLMNETEEALAEIWAEILKIDKSVIGSDSSFFELGGHSLKAIRLIDAIHQKFAVKVTLRLIFESVLISTLANKINSLKKDEFSQIPRLDKKQYYHTSHAQTRIYYHQWLNKDSKLYNVNTTLEIHLEDIKRLEYSFQKLIDRHEGLRTSFKLTEDGLVQEINENVTFKLEKLGRSNISDIKRVFDDFITPFDLSEKSLFRCGLLNIKDDKFLLFINLHHIICDGTSLNILIRDFKQIYEGNEILKPNPVRYIDYADWLNNRKNDAVKKFWVKKLENKIPRLNMPLLQNRETVEMERISSKSLFLDEETSRQILELTTDKDVSDFMVLFSVYFLMLHKITGQCDIIIGIDVAGRIQPILNEVVGTFVNILPIRVEISDGMTYDDFLQIIRTELLEAYENQEYQFDQIVSLVNDEYKSSPIFDQHFSFSNTLNSEVEMEQLGFNIVNLIRAETVSYELKVEVTKNKGSFQFVFTYCLELYDDLTIASLIRHYSDILKTVLSNNLIEINAIQLKG